MFDRIRHGYKCRIDSPRAMTAAEFLRSDPYRVGQGPRFEFDPAMID